MNPLYRAFRFCTWLFWSVGCLRLKGMQVCFSDFNSEVIDQVTVPNVHLNVEERYWHLAEYYSGDWSSLSSLLDDVRRSRPYRDGRRRGRGKRNVGPGIEGIILALIRIGCMRGFVGFGSQKPVLNWNITKKIFAAVELPELPYSHACRM